MHRQRSSRFAVHVAIVFLALGLVQLVGSLVFYQMIDRQTLRDDHARRVAELLVVSDRIHAIAPDQTAQSMTTRHLLADVSPVPMIDRSPTDGMPADIAGRIVAWEPSLGDRALHLAIVSAKGERRNLAGSLQLADGNWLNFQSRDISTMWPIAFRAMVLTFALTIAFLTIGLVVLHVIGKPLRELTAAARVIGEGREIAIPEHGPRDLHDLAHAMNLMQQRIGRLLRDQALSFEAISHDLRTPLARQKVIAGMIDDDELRPILNESIAEMNDLLTSLQAYLRAQHLVAEPEEMELFGFLKHELADFGDEVAVRSSGEVRVTTFREPLSLAIRALVENAVQYGATANVTLERDDEGWSVAVKDEGPGIPEEFFQPILEPFFRLDEARRRNTKGFGLGIPTAHRLMMRFNGGLAFSVPENGGLIARLHIPTVG